MHILFLMTLYSLEMLQNTNTTNTEADVVLIKSFKTGQLGIEPKEIILPTFLVFIGIRMH